MSRKTENRLEDIADAAVACFTGMGIKRTQMVDIARAAHVSAGTLYLYVTSKEALFHLAILRVCDRPIGKLTLPLANPGVAKTAAVVTARIDEVAILPSLRNALKPDTQPDVTRLAAIGGELYDILHDARRAIWLLDRCGPEIPELDRLHPEAIRGRYRDDLAAVALKVAGGTGEPSPDLRLAARLANESIAFASMHRFRESPAHAIGGLSETQARAVATQSFTAILMATANRDQAGL